MKDVIDMSNVIKLANVKAEKFDKFKDVLEEYGDKLFDRLYDQVKLADGEMDYEDVPEDVADSLILGVIVSVLVMVCETRSILSPEALLKIVKHVIKEREQA